MDKLTREAVAKLAAARGERVTRCPSCNELFLGTTWDKDSEYATHQHAERSAEYNRANADYRSETLDDLAADIS